MELELKYNPELSPLQNKNLINEQLNILATSMRDIPLSQDEQMQIFNHMIAYLYKYVWWCGEMKKVEHLPEEEMNWDDISEYADWYGFDKYDDFDVLRKKIRARHLQPPHEREPDIITTVEEVPEHILKFLEFTKLFKPSLLHLTVEDIEKEYKYLSNQLLRRLVHEQERIPLEEVGHDPFLNFSILKDEKLHDFVLFATWEHWELTDDGKEVLAPSRERQRLLWERQKKEMENYNILDSQAWNDKIRGRYR